MSEHVDEEINEEELDKQMKAITGTVDEDEIPHVTLSVESFYTPDQARKFANDVLHLGGIDNPKTLMPIDFNFHRKVIQNDHCYTPLTQSPDRPEKSKTSHVRKEAKEKKREVRPPAKLRHLEQEEASSDSEDGAAGEDDEEYDEEASEEVSSHAAFNLKHYSNSILFFRKKKLVSLNLTMTTTWTLA